tara:strand:- start:9047 stop:9460 length:414 start_codon:yes stop_codon:yes gene_type:complete
MGLEMYFSGEVFFPSLGVTKNAKPRTLYQGFEVSSYSVELMHYRNNWPLHNYILDNFAESPDDCKVELLVPDLENILVYQADFFPSYRKPYDKNFEHNRDLLDQSDMVSRDLKKAIKFLSTEQANKETWTHVQYIGS